MLIATYVQDCTAAISNGMKEFFFEEQPEEAEASFAAAKSKKPKPAEEGQLTVDVYQTEDDIFIRSAIAGVTADDLDISISQDMVAIKGSRQHGEKIGQDDYYYQELYWGPFSRTIILPEDVDADNSKASMKNGILTIKMPKLAKARIKKVKINS